MIELNRILKEIKNIISGDEEIAKLLISVERDEINLPEDILPFISCEPLNYLPDEAVEGNATFIGLSLETANFFDTSFNMLISISVVCPENIYTLANGDSRLLSLAQRIYAILDNKKLSSATKLKIDNCQRSYYNNSTIVGYTLVCFVEDEKLEKNVSF